MLVRAVLSPMSRAQWMQARLSAFQKQPLHACVYISQLQKKDLQVILQFFSLSRVKFLTIIQQSNQPI